MPYLIVGIDPGTTTSIATLNFNGELIDLFSSKNIGLRKAITHLISKGKISVIASDVTPRPDFVSKVATKLGAKVFTPDESLSVQEKILLTKKYKPKDNHQRDSLAAAITAFHFFKPKFQKIDALGLEDEVKHFVIQGLSIKKAQARLEKAKKAGEEKEKEIKEIKEKKEKSAIQKTKEEIPPPSAEDKQEGRKRLERQISRMRKELSERENEIKNLKRTVEKIRRGYRVRLRKEKEIEKRDRSIRNLENLVKSFEEKLSKIDKLKELWHEVAKNKVVPVGLFPSESEVIFIRKKLKEKDLGRVSKVKVAFTLNKKNENHLKEKGILIGDLKCLKEILGFYYIKKEDLENIKEETKGKKEHISIEKIVESYRKERK